MVNYTLTKIKLADYGAAVKLDNHEFSSQENRPPGTENFMAPEVIMCCNFISNNFSISELCMKVASSTIVSPILFFDGCVTEGSQALGTRLRAIVNNHCLLCFTGLSQ